MVHEMTKFVIQKLAKFKHFLPIWISFCKILMFGAPVIIGWLWLLYTSGLWALGKNHSSCLPLATKASVAMMQQDFRAALYTQKTWAWQCECLEMATWESCCPIAISWTENDLSQVFVLQMSLNFHCIEDIFFRPTKSGSRPQIDNFHSRLFNNVKWKLAWLFR